MQIRECDPSHVVVEFSHNEVILLNNALNEICHGMDRKDFSTRLGAAWNELEALRGQIQKVLEGMAKQPDEG